MALFIILILTVINSVNLRLISISFYFSCQLNFLLNSFISTMHKKENGTITIKNCNKNRRKKMDPKTSFTTLA